MDLQLTNIIYYDCICVNILTLMTNALMKAAGSLILYLLVTRQPPTMVAALLVKVNWRNNNACKYV